MTSVDANYNTFIELANRSYGMNDTLLMDSFVGGLIPQLWKEVIVRVPQTVALAKLFEKKSIPHFYSSRQCYSTLPLKPPNQPHSPTLHNQGKLLTTTPRCHNTSAPLLPTPLKPIHLRKLTPADI